MRLWLAVVTLFVCVAVVVVWTLHKQRGGQISHRTIPEQRLATLTQPNVVIPSPSFSLSPTPTPTLAPPPSPIDAPSPSVSPPNFVGVLNLIIPVAGVRPEQLMDTFTQARSEGRTHDAIDIPAASGTSVLAAADGEIVKLFQSERGGTTIYQLSVDRRLVFYYAHLQGYATNLHEGQYVHQGETIAYVGDTGNAGPGNFHLHFSIAILNDPLRYWDGTNIDPYPLLHR